MNKEAVHIDSIPNCPNCKRLMMELDRRNISYTHKEWNPQDTDDIAEMSYEGIYSSAFPVVTLNGRRLPSMSVQQYLDTIMP